MQFINAVIVIKTIAKCSANLQKCSVHGRKSFMLLEVKRKKKKVKTPAKSVATRLLDVAYTLGKVLPTQETNYSGSQIIPF